MLRNFDELKSGVLHEKHALATWILEYISKFAEENQEVMAGRRTFRMHTDF
jgi:hypothetical protein